MFTAHTRIDANGANIESSLLPRLPAHLQRMALFAVNTGLRDGNVCGLEWSWEVPLPQLGRSVFVVPAELFKSKRDRVVILNDAALTRSLLMSSILAVCSSVAWFATSRPTSVR